MPSICSMFSTHYHCNYCGGVFFTQSWENQRFAYHIRDKHPEVWAEDEELRTFAAEAHGVC